MKCLLFQLDGKLPNIALMRLSFHFKSLGYEVELRKTGQPDRTFDDESNPPDLVFASAIFKKSAPTIERLLRSFPQAKVGGTGSSSTATIEELGINTLKQDYSIYPYFRPSIGFTQRGCRLKCKFCVVPTKEGAMRQEQTIAELWRGSGHPRELHLLDNDFFGQPNWADRIDEIKGGDFKVCFSQGINARFLTDEAAAAIASVDYRDDSMKTKRIYTAWDNRKDHDRLIDGLTRLVRYGVKPDSIMVYMLIGYWPGETHEDREFRRKSLREFGARPYPMPFERTQELIGYQRWVIGAYDKKIPWSEWERAKYQPTNLPDKSTPVLEFSVQSDAPARP